jgi:2,3-bisphosphoglycerate-dependent phosphoglycerate mutase
VRIFLLARHGRSLLNIEGLVNGDPSRDTGLSEDGRANAEAMRDQIAAIQIDLAVTSQFPRAQETATIALGGRDVPRLVIADLDDVRIGDLDGKTLADYRAWKRDHDRSDRFPGGETLVESAVRYARAYRAVLARPERSVLVVCHEIPVRYAVNAAGGSPHLDGPLHDIPNAVPYLFGEQELETAAARIDELAAVDA